MTQEASQVLLVLLVLFLVGFVISLAIFLPIFLTYMCRTRYRDFVKLHSKALRELKYINYKYNRQFIRIPNFDMSHSYDNENFYDDISCEDYLIYGLVSKQKEVLKGLKDTLSNIEVCKSYQTEIDAIDTFTEFDADIGPLKRKRLEKIEEDMFDDEVLTPDIDFKITVELTRTNINGDYQDSKSRTFYPKEIKTIIAQLNQKRGNFYTNEDIWHAICRVERGKVSNKMRFAIYARDGYRCKKCGKKHDGDNLEIDHIYPIAKGGKSTYDNLQTLCRKCNKKKGANVEY